VFQTLRRVKGDFTAYSLYRGLSLIDAVAPVLKRIIVILPER
jgi:hypothetical protein